MMRVKQDGSTVRFTWCWRRNLVGQWPESNSVTLCRWSAKQMIPLSVLARNQTKGFGLEISLRPEVNASRELEERTHRRELATGEAEWSWQSTPDSRRDQSAWDRVQKQVREDQSRWVGIPSSFVEISRRMHVSVSLYMQRNA